MRPRHASVSVMVSFAYVLDPSPLFCHGGGECDGQGY